MKVLVVEDNKKLADVMKRGLEQEGFAVDTLGEGIAAEKRILLNTIEYDLVILDRMLPGKDGVSICRFWRAADVTIPVIMLTALDTTNDKVLGLDAGADDYLAKPFAFEELVARVRALMRRPKQLEENKLQVQDIILDTTEHRVTKDDTEITLTLKEFMVLEYLMRHCGKVITRDTLYDHAWDFADSTLSNTVDVHIKNIRKKLHDNGTLIATVRGVGYKME
ncbi:response regulator transcription factor [Candidatus Nomurabacteria bacterium]|nr:MAG: response regulator transcription factor [Candidatus Nomurabacteria bacterium]